mgnify:CR=1 FL=1
MTHIVGDEIHFKGYRVAILTTDAPPTVLGDFTDAIQDGTLFEDEEPHQSKIDEKVSEVLYKLRDEAVKRSRGGLLRIEELAKLLKEEGFDVK